MIHLDHNATAPVAPEVLEAMQPYWALGGNPESRHGLGRAARRAWDGAREVVAEILGARPIEVTFTSGGTEANNLAIFGLAASRGRGGIAATRLEHPAVVGPVEQLAARGHDVAWCRVLPDGIADVEEMAARIDERSCLAALMLAQNETGAIQPVAKLVAAARGRGVPVHTDAVQAAGRIPVSFRALGVTTLAVSAHKFHGPCGIGALLVRQGTALPPQLFGGGQQEGRRPGTPPVALAVGMAEALRLWKGRGDALTARWRVLAGRLEDGLRGALGGESMVRNGPEDPELRLPQTANLGFPGVDGNALLMQLDLAGIAASLGSACSSGTSQPSPALVAMGVPDDRLTSSVRFSFGAETTEAEVDRAVGLIVGILGRIRGQDGG